MDDAARTYSLLLADGNGIYGFLDDAGVVTFVVAAGPGAAVRGTALFDGMMTFFGDRARAIQGVWRKGATGRPSTNIDRVNELTATGVALDEAVRQAWTATRALKRGFRRVSVIGRPEGTAGAYTAIDVLLEREQLQGEV